MAKEVTREQAEKKREKAVEFLQRIGEYDRAEEFADMDADQYAAHKGLRIANPVRRTRINMAQTSGPSRAELQDRVDRAIELLDDAYAVESTREDLADAVGQALDVLNGEDEEEEEDGEEADEEDDSD
jgi:Mg-chelatase subunit ChlI